VTAVVAIVAIAALLAAVCLVALNFYISRMFIHDLTEKVDDE
jgi:hypothetical protein